MLILLAVSPAVLKLGDDVLETLDAKGLDVRIDVEPVTDVCVCPILNRVGNLLGRAKDGALTAGEVVMDQLLDGKAVRLRDAADVVTTVLNDFVVGGDRVEQLNRQRLVRVELLDRNAHLASKLVQ